MKLSKLFQRFSPLHCSARRQRWASPSSIVPSIIEHLEDRVLLAAQVVTPDEVNLSVNSGESVAIALNYDVSDPGNTPPNGLVLRIHYDSTALTYNNASNIFTTGFDVSQDQPEVGSDGDSSTDRTVSFLWFNAAGEWPAGASLPAALLTANFTATGSNTSTNVRFTAITAQSHAFESTPVAVTIVGESTGGGELADIDEELGFTSESSNFFDSYGAGEKWLRAANRDWYLILPDGSLLKWDGKSSATGSLIANVGTAAYANPSLLYDAYQPMVSGDLADIDEELGFSSESSNFFDSYGANEKWLRAANRDWYLILPNGSLLKWDGKSSATGAAVADVGTDVYDNPSLLYDAYQPMVSGDLGDIDEQLGFTAESTNFFNTYGANEKWLQAANRDWYLLLPDGSLVKWSGTKGSATGTTVANVGTEAYADTSLLYNAYQPMVSGDLSAIDAELGFTTESTNYFNLYGASEKWLEAANGDWYLLLPDGSLVKWSGARGSATGATVANVGTAAYAEPSLLYNAFQPTIDPELAAIDEELGFTTESRNFFNTYGANEKWLRAGNGDWYFLLPDGSLIRWDGSSAATGTTIDTLDPSVYSTPALLFDAFQPTVDPELVAIDEEHGFSSEAKSAFNSYGANEKWLRAANRDWFFLLPDGSLLRWDGTSGSATGETIANLDPAVYANPSLLFNAS